MKIPRDLVARTGFEPVISALRGQRPRPLDERATRAPGTEGTPILPFGGAFRPLALAAAALLLASCSSLERAFAPAANPWPIPKESRVRRDGGLLRVYGASLKTRAEAEKDARQSLEAWLWGLEVGDGDDLPARKAKIDGVLASPEVRPVPSPVPEVSGFTSVIEVDLKALQAKLGTHYD
jgi:hypothetical protein